MLAFALQDRACEPPCPFSTPSRVDAFRVELPGDIAKPNAVGLRRGQPSDDLLNAGQRSQYPASFVDELVRQLIALRRRPKRDSLRLHLLQRRARPLGDHRSCNLVIVREIHKQHAPGSAVRLHHAAARQQMVALISEVVADQRSHVAQRPGEPIQLGHDQRVGPPAPDHQ